MYKAFARRLFNTSGRIPPPPPVSGHGTIAIQAAQEQK